MSAAKAERFVPALATSVEGELQARTQFGGIFYLVNAALALGLYGDFTTPHATGIMPLPWDWLALTGRAWFGREFIVDPIWNLLATFAARGPKDEPGQDFIAPSDWVMDDRWLAPWGGVGTLPVHRSRTRIRVLHPAGFVVSDTSRDGHRPPSPRRARERWLRRLLEYLRARLALALDTPASADIPSLVSRHRAEVAFTATHVDVYLSLADLPLRIRMAGLDRDPGWIPAVGSSLRFHFL